MTAAVVLAGCGSADAAKTTLAPLAHPSPSPPPVQPVAGTIETIVDDSSWNDQLGLGDDGSPAEGSVEAATQAVGTALNSFLDSAQAGEPALEHLSGVWLRETDPTAAEVLERGLTNPDNPVEAASYLMHIQLEPNPTLVTTNVQVRRHDGTAVRVEMVFDVASEQPTLHLVGGAEAL